MRNLVRRYVTQEQRKAENEGVTEDDVNEIKNDISAFRFELIEIMRQSGMKVTSASGQLGTYEYELISCWKQPRTTYVRKCRYSIPAFIVNSGL